MPTGRTRFSVAFRRPEEQSGGSGSAQATPTALCGLGSALRRATPLAGRDADGAAAPVARVGASRADGRREARGRWCARAREARAADARRRGEPAPALDLEQPASRLPARTSTATGYRADGGGDGELVCSASVTPARDRLQLLL